MFDNVFANKTVLVTGHTGFKGSWLCIWLKELGANVVGYALEPYTERDNFVVSELKDKITHIIGDVRDIQKLSKVFQKHQPEFIFHLSAQSIVRESYIKPKETYEINIGGTVNVLECCRSTDSIIVIINVTSDKCYENKECVWGYRENDPMGGYDPYSSSKGCSELITAAYRKSFFNPNDFEKHGKTLSSVRSGNVIGGGDWALDRIVPDCMKAWSDDKVVEIRNPAATRPWQHVLEPLSGYLTLGALLAEDPNLNGEPFNFGPPTNQNFSVKDLIEEMMSYWEKILWKDISNQEHLHEAGLLKLCCDKALNLLNWKRLSVRGNGMRLRNLQKS